MRPLLLCLLLFMTAAPGLRADDAPAAQATPTPLSKSAPASAGDVPTYRIAAQDVLDIAVQDHSDLSKTAVVLPDGTISYPYVGEFKAAGLTLHEVGDRITEALRKEIASPQVTVSIHTLHERPVAQVSVLGAVRTQGKHVLHEGWRVLDLIIESGGLPTEHPADFSAGIVRNGAEIIPVDLAKILSATDVKANILLVPDDILIVREVTVTPTQVQILGEVAHPGAIPMPKDGSIVSMLIAAGGLTAKAALTKSTITHNGQTTPVDLSSFLTEGKVSANVKLEAGDTLFIPQNRLFYSVYGAVVHSGIQSYPDQEEVHALEALSQAGGQNTDANLKEVSVVHPVKGGKPEVKTINLEDAMKKGDLSKDIALRPGDFLFVPSRTHKGGVSLSTLLIALPALALLGLK